jgi:hypothetical protein
MGWWRIDGPSGQINWSKQDDGNAMLLNHIPGKHSPENYYNGDEPADVLDKVVSTFLDKMTDAGYKAAAKAAFTGESDVPEILDLIHKQSLENARRRIEKVYQREWKRMPYPEELNGIFEFCTAFIVQK